LGALHSKNSRFTLPPKSILFMYLVTPTLEGQFNSFHSASPVDRLGPSKLPDGWWPPAARWPRARGGGGCDLLVPLFDFLVPLFVDVGNAAHESLTNLARWCLRLQAQQPIPNFRASLAISPPRGAACSESVVDPICIECCDVFLANGCCARGLLSQ